MADFVTLRGYAAPFCQAENYRGGFEYFDPQCFDRMLARGDGAANVFVNFGEHDEPALARPLTLFADEYGLGFSISLSGDRWKQIRPYVVSSHTFCSVNVTVHDYKWTKTTAGETCKAIMKAEIDHVTICNDKAIYSGTGIWPAEIVGKMPTRLAALAARWEDGRIASRERMAALRRPTPVSKSAAKSASSSSFNLDLISMRSVRQRFAHALAHGNADSAPVCHVAFTRLAGFTPSQFEADVQNAMRARRR